MQTMVSTAGSVLVQPPSAQSGEPDDLAPGAKAGPWIVERELGRGGMGAVYAVVHEEIGKRAALKVMHRRLVAGSSAERILLEARVVNQVGHPNIVDIFETGALPDGRPYIVMERLEGVPLSYRADEGKILPDQVIGILLQVCDALIAAHAANIVHRDLKLDNVFLIDNPDEPAQPRVKLLDWGIAKVISTDVRHTVEGQLVGTPQYLAPEQARGAPVSPLTDVYSLGVMAYELFLEQLPFEAETSAEIMAMHLRATPPLPSDLWPDIPPVLEDLLLAMLAKAPDARPSMLTVAHTLELVHGELEQRRHACDGSQAATATPEPRRSTRGTVAPAGRATTDPAAWPETSRRWYVAIGALAIAASASLFVFTRQTEPADASPRPTVEHAFAPVAVEQARAHAEVVGAEAVDHTLAGEPARSDAELVSAPPVLTAASGELPAVGAPQEAADPVRHVADQPAKRARRTARRSQVKPRLEPPLDPDGTLDPYE